MIPHLSVSPNSTGCSWWLEEERPSSPSFFFCSVLAFIPSSLPSFLPSFPPFLPACLPTCLSVYLSTCCLPPLRLAHLTACLSFPLLVLIKRTATYSSAVSFSRELTRSDRTLIAPAQSRGSAGIAPSALDALRCIHLPRKDANRGVPESFLCRRPLLRSAQVCADFLAE